MESRVKYTNLRGDRLLMLHLSEMAQCDRSSSPECEGVDADAIEAYLVAQPPASEEPATQVVGVGAEDFHLDYILCDSTYCSLEDVIG